MQAFDPPAHGSLGAEKNESEKECFLFVELGASQVNHGPA
jgi:hypothetical protein